jgi:anti-sigma factor RsiW
VTADCRQVRDVLDSYISGELLVETNHAVLAHLARCAACARELERRQRLTALLREAYEDVPEVGALRSRIGAAIARDRPRWWAGVARRWSIAALLVVAVAASTWYVLRGVRVDAAALPDSIGDHIECGLTTPAAATFDPARVARRLPPRFAGLVAALRGHTGSLELVDAHACPYRDRRYAHLVFRENGRMVSVFVDDHPRGALPAATLEAGDFRSTAAATAHHQIFVVCDRASSAGGRVERDLLQPSLDLVRGLERATLP